jgi:hypothetical protein
MVLVQSNIRWTIIRDTVASFSSAWAHTQRSRGGRGSIYDDPVSACRRTASRCSACPTSFRGDTLRHASTRVLHVGLAKYTAGPGPVFRFVDRSSSRSKYALYNSIGLPQGILQPFHIHCMQFGSTHCRICRRTASRRCSACPFPAAGVTLLGVQCHIQGMVQNDIGRREYHPSL